MVYAKEKKHFEAFRYGFEKKPEWFLDIVSKCMVSVIHEVHNEDGSLKEESFCYLLAPKTEMTCNFGNYVIKGTRGELYPCDYETFKLSYKPIEK